MSQPVFSTLALSVLLLVGCSLPSKEEPSPEPDPDTVSIPLASIVSTIGQEGLNPLDDRMGSIGFDMGEIRREFKGGASNLFLANADDIVQAVNATRYTFAAGRSAEVPVRPNLGGGPWPASFWLVAFLGVDGSTPPAWHVRSAERRGTLIRLSVSQTERGPRSKDVHPYFVWVPLGKLEPGKYTLELFDAEKKEVTLTRRVAVGAK